MVESRSLNGSLALEAWTLFGCGSNTSIGETCMGLFDSKDNYDKCFDKLYKDIHKSDEASKRIKYFQELLRFIYTTVRFVYLGCEATELGAANLNLCVCHKSLDMACEANTNTLAFAVLMMPSILVSCLFE